VFLVATVATWIPLVVFARARVDRSTEPRLHLVQDMDNQPKLKAQHTSEVFADGREMRLPIPGTDPLATRIGAAWPLDELATRYRTFVARADVALTALRARGAAPDPEQCFVVRTLLIHAYRRALLRDPQLPPALLPDDWPGAHAYARTRDAYRLAFVPSEAHLARVLASAGEPPAPPNAAYQARFGGLV